MPQTYTAVDPRPPGTTNPIRRGLEDEPIYPGPIGNLFDLSGRGFDWLKKKAEEEIARKYQGANDPFWDDFVDGFPDIPAGDEDPNTRKGSGMGDRWIGPPVDKVDASAPSPFAGASDGTEFAFFGGNNKKNTPPPAPTKRTRKGTMDATKASTGMYPSMTPAIFSQKYGISYNEYLALP